MGSPALQEEKHGAVVAVHGSVTDDKADFCKSVEILRICRTQREPYRNAHYVVLVPSSTPMIRLFFSGVQSRS